jgi:hypothetical protein
MVRRNIDRDLRGARFGLSARQADRAGSRRRCSVSPGALIAVQGECTVSRMWRRAGRWGCRGRAFQVAPR